MALYKYEAIDLDRPAVRLLRLLKESSMDDIQCHLFEGWICQSEGGMPYEALSYTWESTEKNAKITVNGNVMYVTSNLYAALQHLRLNTQDRILWIDAICIDQDNLKERGHQVQHMGSIYKEADQVIVWLGRGTSETDHIMDFMKQHKISTKFARDWRTLAQSSMSLECMRSHTKIERLRRGMELIFELPWFRRVWILQEIANARTATIICGKRSVSARIFAQVPSLIGVTPNDHCKAILDLMPDPSRRESWWAQKWNLYTLLIKFRKSEATDERDVIYALLGLSSDACESDILLPDYTKSIEQVIRDTTSFLLTHTNEYNSLYRFLNWKLPEFLDNLDSLSRAVLRIASRIGKVAIFKQLLAMDEIGGSSADTALRTRLQRMAYEGRRPVVRGILERGVELEVAGTKDTPPLLLAARSGYWDVVKLVIDKGAALEVSDSDGQTPLGIAVANGHMKIIRLLLKKNAKINPKDVDDQQPLYAAVMQLLWKYSEQTDLISAAMKGDVAGVQLSLEGGVKLELRDRAGQTPLSLAAEFGHVAAVQLLLEKGAELESRDNMFSQTPLAWAARSGHEAVVRLLLEQGAELDCRCRSNRTPLAWAARGGHEAVVRLLLEAGVELDCRDHSGRTPLFLAAENGHQDVVRLLVAHGAGLESTDSMYCRKPVQEAFLHSHEAVVQLIDRHARPLSKKRKRDRSEEFKSRTADG